MPPPRKKQVTIPTSVDTVAARARSRAWYAHYMQGLAQPSPASTVTEKVEDVLFFFIALVQEREDMPKPQVVQLKLMYSSVRIQTITSEIWN